ncbi:hypothetical protein ACQPX6_10280 [Actinomycetospora sp. CA-101289]|uniref:hypothetical protein n=1 Tax=Actinomycetospora sp. CA-101289 TaxID=3239893 RepID=UPI003D996291
MTVLDFGRDYPGPEDDGPDSWAPIDLGPYLRGEITPAQPSVGLARRDGLRLLYPGKEHAVIGEMESGKSWVALASTATELVAGQHVVYLHFEEADPGDTIDRLRALGVPPADMLARLRFVGPERRVSPDALAALLDPVPSLVILDGVNEAMSLHGWPIREEDGAALFRRHLVKPCTRVGAAVLSADHVPKDPERRNRGAIGSVHKANGLSGTCILLENAEPFGRGQRGRSHVFVTKDRPGTLRRHGRASAMVGKTFLGELTVDDTQQRSPDLELRFWPPADHDAADEHGDGGPTSADLLLEVLAAVPDRTVASERRLFAEARKAGLSLREKTIRDAVEDLIAQGRVVEIEGKRKARGYRAVTAASDDDSTAARTAAVTAAPLEGGRGPQSPATAAGRSGPQWAAVEEHDGTDPRPDPEEKEPTR